MSSVSRERRSPVSVVGASATAASNRARALSDFDPGSSTTASSAPDATGARQGEDLENESMSSVCQKGVVCQYSVQNQ